MNKRRNEEDTASNHETTDKMSPWNIQKETIVLPRITEDLGSASTLRTSSQHSLSEIRSQSPLMENSSDELRNSDELKLPSLVLPLKNEDEVLEDDTRNEVRNKKNFSKFKQSEFYEEELKNLKATMKQLCNEGRELILDYRVKEDEAKKRANQEKKAARNAAKLAETSSSSTFAGAAKTLSKTKSLLSSVRMKVEQHGMNKMQINDQNNESNENNEEVVNDREIDEDSISAIEDDDNKSFDYSAHSRTERVSVHDAKKNSNHVGKKGVGKKEKKIAKVKSRDNIIDSESTEKYSNGVRVTPSDENLEPSKGSIQVREAKEKRKKTKAKRKKVKENEMKENRKEQRETVKETKENGVEDPETKGNDDDHFKRLMEKNFEDEIGDSLHPLPLLRQSDMVHIEQEKFSDLESVVSTLADRSTGLSRTPSVAGLPVQNKVKDKKWFMERFRVPKEPMEIALHLQKCGFDYESLELRDNIASKQKVEGNLKKAVVKEKKEMKEEQKRLEKELRERERKEAYERRMEEILATENKKREQEAREKEERQAKALKRRKSNLELLRNINHTILSTKTSPSFRFSYVPVLPQAVVPVSPEPEDNSGSDVSESEEEHARTIRVCTCEHSGRSVCATLDCKYNKYARTSNRKV